MLSKTFEQLTKNELYALLKLRQDIFIIEQNSIYADLDDLDQDAIHYLTNDNENNLIGYARYRLNRESSKIEIGRVVVHQDHRGTGLGNSIIEHMLADIKVNFPGSEITLSAQLDALSFYHKLGFLKQGESYDDGGIEHITMVHQR